MTDFPPYHPAYKDLNNELMVLMIIHLIKCKNNDWTLADYLGVELEENFSQPVLVQEIVDEIEERYDQTDDPVMALQGFIMDLIVAAKRRRRGEDLRGMQDKLDKLPPIFAQFMEAKKESAEQQEQEADCIGDPGIALQELKTLFPNANADRILADIEEAGSCYIDIPLIVRPDNNPRPGVDND